MKNKRGLNILISSVLIILLAISGIAGIWIYLTKSTDKLEGGLVTDCFSLDLKPMNCKSYGYCNYIKGKSAYEAEVLVRRNAGEGNLNGLRFFFESKNLPTGKEVVKTDVDSQDLKELETKNFKDLPYRVKVSGGLNPAKVSLTPLVGNNNLECNVVSKQVDCQELNPLPALGFTPSSDKFSDYCCQYPWNLTECSPSGSSGSPSVFCCDKVPNVPNNVVSGNNVGTLCSSTTNNCCVDSNNCY